MKTVFEEKLRFCSGSYFQSNGKNVGIYSSAIPYHCQKKPLFIGFAETATALGHAMFSCFAENAPVYSYYDGKISWALIMY